MNRFSILIPLFLFFTVSGFGQIFKLYELDQYTKDNTTDPIKNGNYADINSTLYVTFDKVAIAEAIREFTGSDTISADMLNQLRLVLANQVEIMEGFQTYSENRDLDALNDLATQMQTFFMEADKYTGIQNLYNEYSAKYDQVYPRSRTARVGENGRPFRDEYIFTQMAAKAADLASQIENGISNSNITFSLSGRMSTKKGQRDIKLSDDFDTLEAHSYTVPRWQTEMTEEGKKQLKEIAVLADKLNKLLENKGKDIKNWLLDSFESDDCLKEVESKLISVPQVVATVAPELADSVKNIVKAPYELAKLLSDEYTKNISQSGGITNVQLLENFSSSLSLTVKNIADLIESMDGKLLALLKDLPANPEISAYIKTFEDCKANLEADRNKILNIINRLSTLFGSSNQAANSASGLSDKVRRLSFDAIPKESFIDLRNTGQRTNGDQINIRAVLEQPGAAGQPAVRKIIEQRVFKVQQIGMYSTIKPMLLLANPIGSGDNVDLSGKRFQFAPSYSVLFKFGSRKSKAINEVWQPSFGANFGALDFNTDAVPEFGAGLEFTFLRDYFSLGYGYNFGADKEYFFVGFRLPVGAIPLPIFNEVQ